MNEENVTISDEYGCAEKKLKPNWFRCCSIGLKISVNHWLAKLKVIFFKKLHIENE